MGVGRGREERRGREKREGGGKERQTMKHIVLPFVYPTTNTVECNTMTS